MTRISGTAVAAWTLWLPCTWLMMVASGTAKTTNFDRAVTPPNADQLYTYPYGPKKGLGVEYNATVRGIGGGAAYGLDDSRDAEWQDTFQSEDMDFDPTASDVTR